MGGGGGPSRFFAGGRIDPASSELNTIELRFANGLTLHDEAAEGVALFITDQP